jgi:queuine tRNA-ribosyltransferase
MMSSITTPSGDIRAPAFFPDATRGVIRTLGGDDLAACGVQGVVVNMFHLISRPGVSAVSAHGDIHHFMNWRGPVAADSGGFQAYSLLEGSKSLGSISSRGFTYRLERGGDKTILTAEKCIQAQLRIGADILFCLDDCTHPSAPDDRQRLSVTRTMQWAARSRETFDRVLDEAKTPPARRPLLFAVVQGGEDLGLRRECASALIDIGFDGYGYGGWPITDEGRLSDSVARVAELTPTDRPRFALGIGKPENLVRAFYAGYHLFDCVMPTRDARRGRLFVRRSGRQTPDTDGEFYGSVNAHDTRYHRDTRPVEDGCDCLCCRDYSRSYLHHLFRIGDALAHRLATIHNLTFYRRLVEDLRQTRNGS